MRAMTLPEIRPTVPSVLYPLILRLEAIILFAFLSAAGFSAVAVLNDTFPAWVVSLASGAGTGLLLGLASRWMFRANSAFFRWVAAFTAASVSVLFMGWLTRGLLGADPGLPAGERPDWFAFSLVLLSGATGALALFAWHRPAGRNGLAIEPAEPAERAAIVASAEPPAARTPGRGRAHEPIRGPVVKRMRTPVRERLRGMLGRFRRPDPVGEVKLLGMEEHKCPYCLQKVEDRDPRGVVTCPICRTRHHKDCWAVTGMCQVPHFHD